MACCASFSIRVIDVFDDFLISRGGDREKIEGFQKRAVSLLRVYLLDLWRIL